MRINKIENAQSFNAVYKVKVSSSKLKYFDETVASVYRANKKSGIRAFFKNPSEMFALTGKDAYEFDKHYNQMKRDKKIFILPKADFKDNIIQLPLLDKIFINNYLKNKTVESFDNFNKFLVKLFS